MPKPLWSPKSYPDPSDHRSVPQTLGKSDGHECLIEGAIRLDAVASLGSNNSYTIVITPPCSTICPLTYTGRPILDVTRQTLALEAAQRVNTSVLTVMESGCTLVNVCRTKMRYHVN